jgi:hypothetical protein
VVIEYPLKRQTERGAIVGFAQAAADAYPYRIGTPKLESIAKNSGADASPRVDQWSPRRYGPFVIVLGIVWMVVGGKIDVTGFVTQYKYLAGRSLLQIESLLGFHPARLARGASFATLDRLPTLHEFETAGYSQVAGRRHRAPSDLDPVGLRRMAMSAWAMTGPDRLIKVLATTRHDASMSDDAQYPPGEGVPQWKITRPVPVLVVASIRHGGDIFRLF